MLPGPELAPDKRQENRQPIPLNKMQSLSYKMKSAAAILMAMVLLAGCSQQAAQTGQIPDVPADKNNAAAVSAQEPEKTSPPSAPGDDKPAQNLGGGTPNNAQGNYPQNGATGRVENSGSWKPPWEPQEHRRTYELLTESERRQLPECGSVLMTQSPVPIEKIQAIEPIGSTSPPEHALASSSTDTYIAVSQQGGSTEQKVPLYAPGDMWITVIQPRTGVTQDPEDHVIHYAFCRDVFGIVDHVKGFSPEMKKIIGEYKCQYGGVPGDQACPILLLEPVKAGTLLGYVGGWQGNFNFGTWDLRVTNRFPGTGRYGPRSLHSSCPFDYYAEPLKSTLSEKLEGKRCGTVETYVPGTLQGEWFYGDATNTRGGDWFRQVYFGPSNVFAQKHVVSVGGVISEPLKWVFRPKNEGRINRTPSDVKAGGGIYCYEGEGNFNYDKGPKGSILVQALSDREMQAEYSPGPCKEPLGFAGPFNFAR